MRMRIVTIASLALLLAQGVTLSQEQPSPPEARRQAAIEAATRARQTVRIFAIRYYPVEQLARILDILSTGDETHAAAESSNQLIVQASPARMEEISKLIQQLDVADTKQSPTQSLTCRIYMLEVPAKETGLKPFAVVLTTTAPVSSPQMMTAIELSKVRVSRLLQGHEWTPDGTPRILIKGLAPSNDAVSQMIQNIPQSQIMELKWDAEPSIAAPAAQFSQLPESLQQHIHKFLGQDVQTVGYWFGSLSFPGEVTAPIGSWSLRLKTAPAQAGDLHLEVEVTQMPELIVDTPANILSNSIQSKIGKPIIVSYNRDSYGTRVMGALVILPEADASSAEPEAKPRR